MAPASGLEAKGTLPLNQKHTGIPDSRYSASLLLTDAATPDNAALSDPRTARQRETRGFLPGFVRRCYPIDTIIPVTAVGWDGSFYPRPLYCDYGNTTWRVRLMIRKSYFAVGAAGSTSSLLVIHDPAR